MRYLVQPRERRYVKGYGFLSFARNSGRNLQPAKEQFKKQLKQQGT